MARTLLEEAADVFDKDEAADISYSNRNCPIVDYSTTSPPYCTYDEIRCSKIILDQELRNYQTLARKYVESF